MSSHAVVGWVLTVAAQLRLSRAKTLADLVDAACRVGRGTLSAIGRCLAGATTAKSRIRRTWRFCDNDRVYVADAMTGFINRLTRTRKKPLLVALDWTEVGTFHTLMAAAVLGGRAVPLLGATYTEGPLHRSQNSYEEGLRLLVSLPPERVKVILLADRGFGRTELARTCRELGVRFLIRIKPDVRVTHPNCTGRRDDYPIRKGCGGYSRGCSTGATRRWC